MLTFGFYNSKGGDRKYDAEQIGAMFNGLITDGVFAHYKDALKVTAGSGHRELVVKPGRAWFNGTWTEVDDNSHSIYLMGSAVEATYFVYLAVNKLDRKNTIAWYSNIANNDPESGLYFYLLAQVTIPGGVTKISDSMITDTRGSDLCPYVTGIMETVSFEEIVKSVCGDSWKDWLGAYEAGITTGVQNAVATSERALDEVKSMKAYAVESEDVSYIWAKFEAVPTGGGGFEWATDSVHTDLSDPPMPMCLFRDLSYADLGPGFKPSISLNSPYIADGENAVKAIPAVTQSKVWKEYPYFWEGGAAFGTEVLRYDDLQRVVVNVGGTATEKYRYRVSRLTHIPVTYEPGAYIGTVSADNATAYPRDGHKGGYYYMRFAARAEDVSFDYPDLSAKNVRDAIIEVVHMGGTGSGTTMSVIEVEELPSTGIKGVFYIVKKPGDSDANEYLWLDRWEKVGGTGSGQNVDLDTTLTKSGAAADAKAAGDKITEVMESHETNLAAHPVIQNALEALRNRVNAALNSDDESLDQLAEIVAYIKSNKTLIDAITTAKVSVSDIVNNLVSNVANKPLSAAMGVALAGEIDSVRSSLGGYQPKGDYLLRSALEQAINTALAQAKANGEFNGAQGDPGRGIKSIVRTAGNGAAGTVDTYTITYTDGTTSTFQVRNGTNGKNGVDGKDGQDGFSPIATVTQTATGATINITDKNGTTTATIANGKDGNTPVRGTDYWTPADQEAVVQQVIAALGTPVFGRVDADNNIILTGELADGTYTIKYEDGEGNVTEIGTAKIGSSYINQITISTDIDGSVYNGKGWIENKRIASSGTLSDVGSYGYTGVTGFIPIADGDIIRTSANIVDPNGSSQQSIAFYDADKNLIARHQYRNGTNKFDYDLFVINNDKSITFRHDNAYLDLDKPAAYVRFCFVGITDGAIITTNEEITEQGGSSGMGNSGSIELVWSDGVKLDKTTGAEGTGDGYAASQHIELVDGYTYTFDQHADSNGFIYGGVNICYYDANGTGLGYELLWDSVAKAQSKALSPVSGAKTFRVRLYYGEVLHPGSYSVIYAINA